MASLISSSPPSSSGFSEESEERLLLFMWMVLRHLFWENCEDKVHSLSNEKGFVPILRERRAWKYLKEIKYVSILIFLDKSQWKRKLGSASLEMFRRNQKAQAWKPKLGNV